MRRVLTTLGLLTLMVCSMTAPVLAAPGGNSAAAQACQQGGYASYIGNDGTHFGNAGDCDSYAAQHGGAGSLVLLSTLPDFVTSISNCQVVPEGNNPEWTCAFSIDDVGAAYSGALSWEVSSMNVGWNSLRSTFSTYLCKPPDGNRCLPQDWTTSVPGVSHFPISDTLVIYQPAPVTGPGSMTLTVNPGGTVLEQTLSNDSSTVNFPLS